MDTNSGNNVNEGQYDIRDIKEVTITLPDGQVYKTSDLHGCVSVTVEKAGLKGVTRMYMVGGLVDTLFKDPINPKHVTDSRDEVLAEREKLGRISGQLPT